MKALILSLLLIAASGCTMQAQNHAVKLEPAEFSKKITGSTIQLIDIRTPQEYAKGHISNAQNVDYYSATFYADMDKYNKSLPLYIYCRSGNRTSLASSELHKLGFTQIFDLKTGFNGWQAANLPTAK